MIGIYIIKNNVNGKIYIGKSIDIEKRWKEHIRHSKDEYSKSKPAIHRAINKYGKDSFSFSVLEECSIEQLNEREKYYIKKYNSNDKNTGYNFTEGGDGGPIMYGSKNPNSVVSEDIVIFIRECYNNGVYKMDCYDMIKQSISLNINTFNSIWFGRSYKNIIPDVFTEENRQIHRNLAWLRRTPKHCEKYKPYVLEIRQKKKSGLSYKDVKQQYDFINVCSFNDIWHNRTFKYIQPS